MKLKFYALLCLLVSIMGCGEDGLPVTLETAQIERLLTANVNKNWVPVPENNIPECETDNVLTFTYSTIKDKPGTFVESIGSVKCNEMEVENSGTYKVALSESGKNQIKLYGKDTVAYQVNYITASRLSISTDGYTKTYYSNF